MYGNDDSDDVEDSVEKLRGQIIENLYNARFMVMSAGMIMIQLGSISGDEEMMNDGQQVMVMVEEIQEYIATLSEEEYKSGGSGTVRSDSADDFDPSDFGIEP